MNYIIAEIQDDDILKVLVWNVPENDLPLMKWVQCRKYWKR